MTKDVVLADPNFLKKEKAARIIAIIAFIMVMSALTLAFTSDAIIFMKQILIFIFACFASIAIFIIAFVLMIISFMLIFGVVIAKNSGFWPISWAKNTFTNIINEARLDPNQIQTLMIIRIIILSLCIISLVLVIISKSFTKSIKQTSTNNLTKKDNNSTSQSLTIEEQEYNQIFGNYDIKENKEYKYKKITSVFVNIANVFSILGIIFSIGMLILIKLLS